MAAASCKWCAQGECWTHTGKGKGTGKGGYGGWSGGCSPIMMQMMAMKGLGYMGKGGTDFTSEEQKVCSVHGKARTDKNLEPDGAGGFKCVAGMECQISDKPEKQTQVC